MVFGNIRTYLLIGDWNVQYPDCVLLGEIVVGTFGNWNLRSTKQWSLQPDQSRQKGRYRVGIIYDNVR